MTKLWVQGDGKDTNICGNIKGDWRQMVDLSEDKNEQQQDFYSYPQQEYSKKKNYVYFCALIINEV